MYKINLNWEAYEHRHIITEAENMSKIYDKMFLKNENKIKYKQLIHITKTNNI